ncbi:MAG: Methyltransferase type 11 [Jatrophihabitans sp.]|nr:Methyltransferase type 11 [Jatrophihabitans sp.]
MSAGCDLAWTTVAPQWDRLREHVEAMKADLTPLLLDALAIGPGNRVLELGGGTGELAARLAAAVAPGGSLVASDLAPGMVTLLEDRVGRLPGVEVAQLDATNIAQASEQFDAVAFRMGLMLIPEPDTALREILRVLRPGGRLAVAVWGAPQDNPWMTCVGMAAMMHGLVSGGPPVGPGSPFSLADPDELEKLVRGAGYSDVSVRVVDSVVHFPDVETHAAVVGALAPPLAAAFAAAPDDTRAAVRRTLGELTSQYAGPDGIRLPVRAVMCSAQR